MGIMFTLLLSLFLLSLLFGMLSLTATGNDDVVDERREVDET
jgi:hypothetical protein